MGSPMLGIQLRRHRLKFQMVDMRDEKSQNWGPLYQNMYIQNYGEFQSQRMQMRNKECNMRKETQRNHEKRLLN